MSSTWTLQGLRHSPTQHPKLGLDGWKLDMELAGWLHPEQLNVQMAISKKWCPSGVSIGTDTV